MHRRRTIVTVLVSALLPAAVLAPAASAQRVQSVGISSYIPLRIDHLIGFTPSHGMYPAGAPVKPTTVRLGGRTHRFVYPLNSAVVWPDTGLILRTLMRNARYASGSEGGFVDRRLSRRQRKRLTVRLDLGRDADVLAVAAGHPACAGGLTRAQARGIATGEIRRWSAVGAEPGGSDTIALRVTTDALNNVEPRLGLRSKAGGITSPPPGARGARDGGLAQAAGGDTTIAAVTSWTRARTYGARVCAVPVGGVTPTDATVTGLTYREAYPISYVVSRRLPRSSAASRAALKGFLDWLGGPQAAEQFRARGMLLVD